MYSKESILTAIFIFVSAFSAAAQKQAADEWSIGDYLENLPEKYKTYSGDFPKPPPKNSIILDEENGYAAILRTPPEGMQTFDNDHTVFEMAIFKRVKGEPLIVVSNEISDSVCVWHETFFLERRGNSWLEVRSRVLPQLSAQMFFKDAKLAAKFTAMNKKIGNRAALDLHFAPPRKGTQMKVSLDICDFVPDEFQPEMSFDEFTRNSESLFLDWDKQKGIFQMVK